MPQTIQQAFRRRDKKEWMAAVDRKYQALVDTSTFEPITLPLNRTAIPTICVIDIKYSGLHKARTVVQGFRQKEGMIFVMSISKPFI